MRAFVPASAATGDGNPAASEACRKYSGSSLTNPLTAFLRPFLDAQSGDPTALTTTSIADGTIFCARTPATTPKRRPACKLRA